MKLIQKGNAFLFKKKFNPYIVIVYLANKSEADSDVKSTDEFAYQYGRRQNKRQ